jgi:hypothetical protein
MAHALTVSQPSTARLPCSDEVTNNDEVIRHPRHREAVSKEADPQTTEVADDEEQRLEDQVQEKKHLGGVKFLGRLGKCCGEVKMLCKALVMVNKHSLQGVPSLYGCSK